jgi:hypothetical protein
MPELPLCFYCEKAIDQNKEDYVPVTPGAQDSPSFGEVTYPRYAHAKCHNQMAGIENG